MKDPLDKWHFESKDVAEFFGVSVWNVQYRADKYLGRKIGGHWRFNIASILRLGEIKAKNTKGKK